MLKVNYFMQSVAASDPQLSKFSTASALEGINAMDRVRREGRYLLLKEQGRDLSVISVAEDFVSDWQISRKALFRKAVPAWRTAPRRMGNEWGRTSSLRPEARARERAVNQREKPEKSRGAAAMIGVVVVEG